MAAPVVVADVVDHPPRRPGTPPASTGSRWRTAGRAGLASPDPAEGFIDRQALLGELAKLSRRQRTALVLRYYEGLSDAEIAEVMGCTQSTVRGHVFKALAALRIELDQPLAAAAPSKETH